MDNLESMSVAGHYQFGQQLSLFDDDAETPDQLDSRWWQGSFNGIESSLQQLSPYVGKLKSGMVNALLKLYSQPGEIVLDPFSGSGVVPLESVLAGRCAWANDLSPYAYVVTCGKLEAPASELEALQRAQALVARVEAAAPAVDLAVVPEWVSNFFHPDTLREIVAAVAILREEEDHFLMACLLGILHHVRPGFLSYPASHLVPYLRREKYPPDEFPGMYRYRDLKSRLLAKVQRAYRRPLLPRDWNQRKYRAWQVNSMTLPIEDESVDAVISSPPYFGALDYARDNRLRLWFLGVEDWKRLDSELTASRKVYVDQMSLCLKEMGRVLKPKAACVLVLGDVQQGSAVYRTAEILADLATHVTAGGLRLETIYDDTIPEERRSRRRTQTTKLERILVMKKR